MKCETVLTTERLRLTTWLPEHLDDIIALHNDLRVTKYLTADGLTETRAQAEERLASWTKEFAATRLCKMRVTLKDDNTFIGRAGFGVFEKTNELEIGYVFRPDHWGKGYAFEVASALRDWFFKETDHAHFVGFANVDNGASIHILQKIGMIPTHVGPDDDGHPSQFHIYRRENWHG